MVNLDHPSHRSVPGGRDLDAVLLHGRPPRAAAAALQLLLLLLLAAAALGDVIGRGGLGLGAPEEGGRGARRPRVGVRGRGQQQALVPALVADQRAVSGRFGEN